MFQFCLKIPFFIDSDVEDFAKVSTIVKVVSSTWLLPLVLFCSKDDDI